MSGDTGTCRMCGRWTDESVLGSETNIVGHGVVCDN
jgi:hypothetical protein